MNIAAVFRTESAFPQSSTSGQGHTKEIALKKGQLQRWTGHHRGMVIEVREGTVWVTQQGDNRDFLVSRGESFHATRPGRIVAESLVPFARVVMHEQPAA